MFIQSKVIAWWKKYSYMVFWTIVKYILEFLLDIYVAKWNLQYIISKESFFILMHLKTINIATQIWKMTKECYNQLLKDS